MLYVYGWPAGAKDFTIEFWDATRDITIPITPVTPTPVPQKQNRISFDPTTLDDANILEGQPGLLLAYPNFTAGRGRPFAFPVNEPPSLATLRWMVRAAVNDVTTEDGVDVQYPETPKWTDTEIDGYLREGIGFINRYMQREIIIETTMERYRDRMIERITEIVGISFYHENTQEWLSVPRFSRRGHRGDFRYWDLNNGRLKLYGSFPAETPIEIHVRAPYPVPINDKQELFVDRDDWDILSIYAQAKCYLRLAGQSAQLDRWKEDGRRNDNPLTPVARLLLQEAEQRLKDRRGPRAIRRYRA